jgi:hypothetical protein
MRIGNLAYERMMMVETHDQDDARFIVEPVYRLANRIISILGAIVFLAVLAFLALVGAYTGIRLRRDNWASVMYAEELNSAKSSVTLQRTDRHGILGQKPTDWQVSL